MLFRGSSAKFRRAEEIAAEKNMLRNARDSNLQRVSHSRTRIHTQLTIRTEMCDDTFRPDTCAVYADPPDRKRVNKCTSNKGNMSNSMSSMK